MPLIILSVLIQLAAVIHIVKTGRSNTWIWVVATLPLVGPLAYLLLEVIGNKAQRHQPPQLTAHELSALAEQQIQADDYHSALNTLSILKNQYPNQIDQQAHLLYARTQAGLNNTEQAEDEFEALRTYFVGPEADYRYAVFCLAQNRADKAKELLQGITENAQCSASHQHWLLAAQQLLEEHKTKQ